MTDVSAYDKPQPLRRLIEDILSPEKLRRFGLLDDAYRAAKRRDIPWEHFDCADDEWQSLHHEIDDGAKEIFATGELLLRGWLKGATDHEPTILPPSLLADSQLWVAENEARASGTRYVSCTVIQRAALPLHEPASKATRGSPGRAADPSIEGRQKGRDRCRSCRRVWRKSKHDTGLSETQPDTVVSYDLALLLRYWEEQASHFLPFLDSIVLPSRFP